MITKKKKIRANKKRCKSDSRIKQKGIHPKKNIKAYSSLDNFPILFFAILSAYIIAFFAFRYYFSYTSINISDVTKVNGTIERYELEGSKSKALDIKLKEYPVDFYIPAKSINYESFKQNEAKGNYISFLINKRDDVNLKNSSNKQNSPIDVYGISTAKYNYMDIKDSNEYGLNQARCAIILGIMMISAGTFLVYYLIKEA